MLYYDIERDKRRSNDFEKGKAMNAMTHIFCFNFMSQQSALFSESQQGFKFMRKNKVKQNRDNCVFIKDKP